MHVKVDQAGRIVIPKSLRDRFGLRKDSELEIKESDEGVVLKPVEKKSGIVRRNGRLVIVGRPVKHVDWDHIIEEEREERMREIGGW